MAKEDEEDEVEEIHPNVNIACGLISFETNKIDRPYGKNSDMEGKLFEGNRRFDARGFQTIALKSHKKKKVIHDDMDDDIEDEDYEEKRRKKKKRLEKLQRLQRDGQNVSRNHELKKSTHSLKSKDRDEIKASKKREERELLKDREEREARIREKRREDRLREERNIQHSTKTKDKGERSR